MSFVIIFLVVFVFIIIAKGVRIVKEQEVVIIERLGKYDRMLSSGLNIILPIVDNPRSVLWRDLGGNYRSINAIDLRETVLDFPSQRVITKDNVVLEINAVIYFQITDPVKAIYEIMNLPEAIEKLTQTSLRNVIGDLDLDGTLTSRDHINTQLRVVLDEASHKWGVKVNRVELQDIVPPRDIRDAMEKQMRAERDKRAALLEAEAKKISAVLKAEGERDSEVAQAEGRKKAQVLEAQGLAEARLTIARAEAESISTLAGTAGNPDLALNYLIAIKYIEAFAKMSQGQANTVFLPFESSSLMSTVGGIKEIFQRTQPKIEK
ncbi:MAG: SPFH domain-containing protein [Candidatus Caenarcaniphilales bacterium]|nr:SPFH domain-containing protein [Candidatus Caenarcaniphilales bacterium]